MLYLLDLLKDLNRIIHQNHRPSVHFLWNKHMRSDLFCYNSFTTGNERKLFWHIKMSHFNILEQNFGKVMIFLKCCFVAEEIDPYFKSNNEIKTTKVKYFDCLKIMIFSGLCERDQHFQLPFRAARLKNTISTYFSHQSPLLHICSHCAKCKI